MGDQTIRYNFVATGIGSVPFLDIEETCRVILEHFPTMPFWPQFVKRSYVEDMNLQYSEGLPLLEINKAERSLTISSISNSESELAAFYEHFLSRDTEYFSISRDYAPGLFIMLDLIRGDAGYEGPYIKGQTIGPVTFAAGILDLTGKPVLYNAELLEAMVNGLSIKALWQVEKLGESGKRPIIFLDEPYLSGFGSAFSPIQRHEVINILRVVIDFLRENSSGLIGIHCCGNTDWSMIVEAQPDIINFDAFMYMDHFLLYREDILRFLNDGGTIAWGIIPTSGLNGGKAGEELFIRIKEGFGRLLEWGIAPDMLAERSILTPACGMGTMAPEAAKTAMELLSNLSQKCKEMALK